MTRDPYARVLAGMLLLFAFCLPWSKSAVSVLIIISAATMVLALVRRPGIRAGVRDHLVQPLTMPFLALLGIALVGLLYTERTGEGLSVVNKVVKLPLTYLLFSLILQVFTEPRDRDGLAGRALIAFVAGVVVLDLIAFLTYFGAVGHKKGVLPLAPMRMHHIWFSNLNAIGAYTAVSLVLFGEGRKDRRLYIFLAAASVLSAGSIILSLSRTAWIAMLLTALAMTFLFARRKRLFYASLAGVAIGSVLIYQSSAFVQERVNAAFADLAVYASGKAETTSLGDRLLMWQAAGKMFLSDPILGVGTGDYNATMTSYVRAGMFPEHLLQYNQPHNMYLLVLATGGLVGLAALLWVHAAALLQALTARNKAGTPQALGFLAAATVVHFLIAGLAESLFSIFVLRFTFAFIMAITVRKTLKTH